MGDKANFDVLEGFLSALLVEDIIIEQVLESKSCDDDDSEFNHLDMVVHNSHGRKFIATIQNEWDSDYLERLHFAPAKLVADHTRLRGAYLDVVKVVAIHIIYCNLSLGDDYIYKSRTEFKGRHFCEELELRDHRTIVITEGKLDHREKDIFPEYYLINVGSFEDIITNPLDEWIYFLKHSAVRANFQARHIDKAMDKLTLLKMSPAERRRYEDYVKSLVVERDVLATAERDGIEKGIEIGRQEGRQEGLQEGQRLFLLRILERKFGPLSEQAKKRLMTAPAKTLLLWGESVLDATNLDDIFSR